MLSLKSEKGFTLVELLVSMCILAIVMTELMALMFNSSKLYKNGAYEVNLQSEAQQIIQQFEEFAIDADTSVSYNEATKVISITNKTGYNSYEISLSPVAGKDYNDLLLKVNGGTPQIMGEYVKSISLNMANYDNASRVIFVVEMENDKYAYNAAKDIYLRNDIGANDIHSSAVVSEKCDYELNVLRYHTYDLDALFGGSEDYRYAFDVTDHLEYEFSGPYSKEELEAATSEKPDSDFKVHTSSAFNTNGDTMSPSYQINAYKWDGSQYVIAKKIKIYSEPVFWGLGGYGCAFLGDTTADFDNYFSVQGVSLDPVDIQSISFSMCLYVDVNESLVSTNPLYVYGKCTGDVSIKGENINDNQKTKLEISVSDNKYPNVVLDIDSFGTFTGGSDTSDVAGVMSLTGVNDLFLAAGPNLVEGSTFFYDPVAACDVNFGQLKLFGNCRCKIDVVNNDFILINKTNYKASSDRDGWHNFIKKYGIVYLKVKFQYPGKSYDFKIYPLGAGICGYPEDTMDRFDEIAN